MSNLLKYTVPTWNDHVYGYNDSTLRIKTTDSVIRIFGILNESIAESIMGKIINGDSVRMSKTDLHKFVGSTDINLDTVYNAWTNMEAQNNAPHIVLGFYNGATFCAWIDSWEFINDMRLRRINPSSLKNNTLRYLTETPDNSSLLALSMFNGTAYECVWKDHIEYRNYDIDTLDTLAAHRYNLNPVPVGNQGNLLFNNWTVGNILISLNSLLSYNLFDAQVSDLVLSSTGLNWIERTSSTGETCTLATDLSSEITECAIVGSSVIWYKTAPYHPVSRIMDTNYKGVYTTPEKDTIFINGGSYKPTSLLKYTNKLLRKD